MNLRFFQIYFFILISLNGLSQNNFGGAVDNLLRHPDYKNASIGIHVQDLDNGKTLFDLNSEKLLIPASTMKLITTASALEILGSDYQFETKLGYLGTKPKNNLLKGDLVVVGGGDPTLGSEHFNEHYFEFLQTWAQKVKAAGIQTIEGDLILDGSLYDSEKVPRTWIWEDMGNYYGAGANALTIYDNLFRITFNSPRKAGKQTKIISMYPGVEGIDIKNEVLSADNNRDLAYVFGGPLDKKRIVRGTIPRNRNAFTIKAAIHHPEEILAKEFIKALAVEGIFISGSVKYECVNKNDFETLYIQRSPELGEIIKTLNYKSINLFAEHLVRQIAAEENGTGNRETAIEIIKGHWQSKGISTEDIFIEDGSGLSHFNAVSPKFFTELLYNMYSGDNKKVFINSLPSAGKGTMSSFNTQLFPGETLKAKSGSMTRVRCYAGYLKLSSGKTVAFSLMANHFSGSHSQLRSEIEKLLFELSKE